MQHGAFTGKTIYISGKITGVDNYQERFNTVERMLYNAGAKYVFNPARAIKETETHKTAMLKCLSTLTSSNTFIDTRTQDTIVVPHFDYVLMLPDWEDSKGARMEYDVADICGIPITFYCNHFSKLLP